MGRPKMSEEEKEAARAARANAKASASAKADKAEARSSASKASDKTRAGSPSEGQSLNNFEDLDRALFLHHLPIVKRAREAVGTATANLRNALKSAKAEGNFTKADFDTAAAIETAEKEARERAKIARQLRIAKIMGSSLGNQLDMFLEPDRTPATEIAAGEGERDAIENKPAKPKYDPSTEQFRSYMTAYHGVSEKRIKDGIGKKDPEAAEMAEKETATKVKVDTQKAEDDKAFAEFDKPVEETVKPVPQSGTPMTRAQFKAQQEAQKATAAK